MSVEKLVNRLKKLVNNSSFSSNEKTLINRALRVATAAHLGQKRKNGAEFIIHPIETAIRLMEWEMDYECVCAGLLHDVVEDTPVKIGELQKKFGPAIANLVSFVTKVTSYSNQRRRQNLDWDKDSEYLRQIYLSLAQDPRAIIVKLADRLHNMLTIDALSESRQILIARETLEIYGELAGLIGMYEIKSNLQDLSFKILDPIEFQNLDLQMQPLLKKLKNYSKKISLTISNILETSNISFRLEQRVKSYYSTYKKLQQGLLLKEIRDLNAFRIIVNSIEDCYAVLGKIHASFTIAKGSFRDYISNPKTNLYQSLHTTIIFKQCLFEVQIRTEIMNETANNGIAAHWKYKLQHSELLAGLTGKIREAFLKNNLQPLKTVKKELLSASVVVYLTNQNSSVQLPKGATVLDLAFAVAPRRAPFLLGARVGGKQISVSVPLINNSYVDLVFSNTRQISNKWLKIVHSQRAKNLIGSCLKNFTNEVQAKAILEKISHPSSFTEVKLLTKRVIENGFKDLAHFNEFSSAANLSSDQLEGFIGQDENKYLETINILNRKILNWLNRQEYIRAVSNEIFYNRLIIENCCDKIPHDEIRGILENDFLKVHHEECPKLSDKKIIPLEWNEQQLSNKIRYFKATIKIIYSWSEYFVNECVKSIIAKGVLLANVNLMRNKKLDQATVIIAAYYMNTKHFDAALNLLTALQPVIEAKRIIFFEQLNNKDLNRI